ncbi:MAG: ABC transporter permease [Bryobacteraceae bacterium]|nr:ABC transporter permease [Bryobacteraceae bacterium]
MNWTARLRPSLDAFALDLKLGGRMVVKYPGLTIIAGLAMAFAICAGIVVFEVVTQLTHPTLPLPAGDRIVQIRNWDVATNRAEDRALHDFNVWRSALRSITQLGAWRDLTRNLTIPGGGTRTIAAAEITASAFPVAAGSPLFGRVLLPTDEHAGAPPVAVLGYEVWRTRFGGDPGVLGKRVQLGNESVTIVGVMREGFAFPVAHDLWTALRPASVDRPSRSGPAIKVFGVLAPGVDLDAAQAELSTIGRRAATEQPATHEHLQPRVTPYAQLFISNPTGEDWAILLSIYVFALMLLTLVCGNVALLLFARAATREGDLVVRTALGATRGRIVAQIFGEALVLAGVAGLAGLVAAHFILLSWGVEFLEVNLGPLPFWFDLSLSPATVLFAAALTVIGAVIAGVLPALKITRGTGMRLKQSTAGGGGLQFGGIWTVAIVAQVAVTVAFPAVLYFEQWQIRRVETFDVGFSAGQYLGGRLDMDAPVASTIEEVRRRIAAAPGVSGVTFADRLPATSSAAVSIELPVDAMRSSGEANASAQPPLRFASLAGVEPGYFDVLETPILAGRAFRPADLQPGARVAIVDQAFVEQVLEGRHAIGQQVRFVDRDAIRAGKPPGPWYEIVGVVKELGMGSPIEVGRASGIYLPASPDRMTAVHMLVHVKGDPITLAPQLHEIASSVDPMLRLSDVKRLTDVHDDFLWGIRLWVRVTVVISAAALLLSLAGIYAVLSFTVSRRTREIGVRVALGGSQLRVLLAIFRKPLLQVTAGIAVGGSLIVAVGNLKTEMPGLTGDLSPTQFAIIVAYAIFMLGVCLLGCVVPARRALKVEPTVALRTD